MWVCLFVRWNQLDVVIIVMSVVGIVLEEIKSGFIPINPTIIRVMRVMRIARGQLGIGLWYDYYRTIVNNGPIPYKRWNFFIIRFS